MLIERHGGAPKIRMKNPGFSRGLCKLPPEEPNISPPTKPDGSVMMMVVVNEVQAHRLLYVVWLQCYTTYRIVRMLTSSF
ncbi:hypothetical protein [Alkalimonas amylolytica]|uniref:hypothetical protein n=1 Tax=Alkalimonas amylolytica TaxID=152573 RepID=UPI001114BDA5|nr:hypothetical protein [Alkalimonas amylolytica]